MPSPPDQSRTERRQSGRKNTLFCPQCPHASPTTGDWRVRPTAAGLAYECPECGARLTTRRPSRPAPSSIDEHASDCGMRPSESSFWNWSTRGYACLPGIATRLASRCAIGRRP